MHDEIVLRAKDLRTYFYLEEGTLKAVDGASFDLRRHRTLGIIGESGCGKSVTASTLMRLVPPPGELVDGEIVLYPGTDKAIDLASLPDRGHQMRAIRGKCISMVFQEPMTSFSPVHTIGNQIIETILLHRTRDKKEAHEIAVDMLRRVGFPDAQRRVDAYPHQLSGGMRQRAMIAMALACHPDVLIADEPTTALDVTIQAQMLELINQLREEIGMAVLFITHDLGVIAEIADDVAVMYLGKIVEQGATSDVLTNPLHPYTRKLLKSVLSVDAPPTRYLEVIEGTVPMPLDLPQVCGFASRCLELMEGTCDRNAPALTEAEPGHLVRCFLCSDEKEQNSEQQSELGTAG